VEPTAWRGGYWPLRMPFCAGANLWYRRRPSIPVALTALALAVPVVDQLTVKSLAVHVHAVYAGYGVPEPPASVIVTYLVVVGAIGTVSWLIAIWAIRHHRRWARPVATALFLLATGLAVVNLTASEYGNQTVCPSGSAWWDCCRAWPGSSRSSHYGAASVAPRGAPRPTGRIDGRRGVGDEDCWENKAEGRAAESLANVRFGVIAGVTGRYLSARGCSSACPRVGANVGFRTFH